MLFRSIVTTTPNPTAAPPQSPASLSPDPAAALLLHPLAPPPTSHPAPFPLIPEWTRDVRAAEAKGDGVGDLQAKGDGGGA